MEVSAGLVSRRAYRSEADNPADGRPGCPRRPRSERSPKGVRQHAPLAKGAPRALQLGNARGTADRIGLGEGGLGSRLLILGHHYQRDEVMRWADARGDSFGLSRIAAETRDADYVVFCGVHFMAESADVLTSEHQQVLLPDLNAGCSMADMADLDSVEEAWESLAEVTDIDRVLPITYMNSSAALKAFVGRNGGAVCTSSNCRAVLSWALDPDHTAPEGPRADKVLFFPDQHLGRNTGFELGWTASDMVVWDPRPRARRPRRAERQGGDAHPLEGTLLGTPALQARARGGLSCRASGRHRPRPPRVRTRGRGAGRQVGSTDAIIRAVDAAPPGTVIGVATEIHLVNRLATEHPDLRVESLDPIVCPCSTMSRIDAAHLCWVLEGLVEGEVRNRITVDTETAAWARVALERMLAIT